MIRHLNYLPLNDLRTRSNEYLTVKYSYWQPLRSVLSFRVFSRTNLSYPSRRSTSKPQCFSDLPTLDLSLRSFSHSDPLFSITSALFLQNTRGGIPPAGPF